MVVAVVEVNCELVKCSRCVFIFSRLWKLLSMSRRVLELNKKNILEKERFWSKSLKVGIQYIGFQAYGLLIMCLFLGKVCACSLSLMVLHYEQLHSKPETFVLASVLCQMIWSEIVL